MNLFPPRLRKLTLTLHVTSSVGRLGAVAAFLALAVTGLTSSTPQTVRGAYLAMDVVGWYVIVPFSVASLLSGLVQSLGTVWGLLHHYWVIAKLLITGRDRFAAGPHASGRPAGRRGRPCNARGLRT